ncbi:MAG TPA: ABC transporter substrate-binding protein [Gammaproteobacteria bacterium]|nr:ABC transporter substrate-binding protein [Gammaproteobacteria bacterium]
MMHKLFLPLALIAGLLALSPAFAAASNNSNLAPPDRVVEQTATDVLSTIRKNQNKFSHNPHAVYELVQKDMAPHFDFEYAARLVLGRHWRDASEQQRKAFIEAFEHYLVNSYADELVKQAGAKVKVEPFRGSASDERANIRTTVIPENGKPIQVDYAMHRTDGGWKAFDVRAEGISYVMSYRNTFDNEINQTSLEALIKRLQQKAETKAKQTTSKARS